jgi:hypothetical protein
MRQVADIEREVAKLMIEAEEIYGKQVSEIRINETDITTMSDEKPVILRNVEVVFAPPAAEKRWMP